MFTVIPKHLLTVMQSAPRLVMPAKSTLRVLDCIRLTVDASDPFTLTLEATDLDRHLHKRFTLTEPAVPGTVLVPYREFARIKPTGSTPYLYLHQGKVLIADPSGGPSFSMDAWPSDDFPPQPVIPPDGPCCDFSAVLPVLSAALPFASKDETRYVLNGVFVDTQAVVATDGRRLFRATVQGTPIPVILPTQSVRALIALFKSGPVSARFLPEGDAVSFTDGTTTLYTRTIHGNYPNYRQVIPDRAETTAILTLAKPEDVIEFLTAIPRSKRSNSVLISKASAHAIRLIHDSGSLTTPAAMDADFRESAFDPHFLADCIRSTGPTVHLIDPICPITFRSPTALSVLMPMRIAAPETEEGKTESQTATA